MVNLSYGVSYYSYLVSCCWKSSAYPHTLEYNMWGRIIEYTGGVKYEPPKKRRKIMAPNPHYINMLINFSILGTLIYVALQVS